MYKLEKPFTNKQRADFIVEHDGLRAIETDEALILLEHEEDEMYQELQKEQKIIKLKTQLEVIDSKKMRSTSAIALGIATQDDIDYLTNLEAQAEKIREEIRRIQECH